LKSKIEVDIEVAHRELSQRAINRLPIPAAGEVRLRDRAPMSAQFENGNNVIGVLFRFQIKNERRKSENTKRGRGENSAFETGCGAFVQNVSWRARGVAEIIGQLVQESLHAGRGFQGA